VKFVLTENAVLFGEAGRYALDDPFKPHLAELLTPAGHNLTLVSPADHRHHKGVMYALRCADLNFWEEDPGSGSCGVREIISTEVIGDGVRQQLLWRGHGGGLETYRETRTITCRLTPDGCGHQWTWQTRRRSLRPHRLIQSPWSTALADGRRINYHGLGFRLPWVWSMLHPAPGGFLADGKARAPEEACGSECREVSWCGPIDGHWNVPHAALTAGQERRFTWFVLRTPFPYLAIGPSNAAGFDVAGGVDFEESYTFTAADR
jgi:hypothetical protein